MADEGIDRALRRLAGDPRPTEQDCAEIRRILEDAIAEEPARRGDRPVGPKRWSLPAMATVAAVVVVAVIVASQVGRPTTAEAALSEIATVAEQVHPAAVPDQSYFYVRARAVAASSFAPDSLEGVRTRHLSFLVPQVYEFWVGADGTEQVRVTNQTPSFFSSQDEADYSLAGLDRLYAVGEAETSTSSGFGSILDERVWPNDPEELRDALGEALPQTVYRPEAVELLDVALDLLRRPDTPEDLRAATLRVIGGLGLTLEARTSDGGGTFTIAYERSDDQQRETMSITLDGSGRLLHESITYVGGGPDYGIPPGTVTYQARYELPVIVDSLDPPAAG